MKEQITCIIVDDEKLNREELKLLIKESGLDIILLGEAEDGRRGLELIDEFSPDLVITDVRMPHIDGIEMIAKSKENNHQPIFIIISGYAEFEYASKAISLGVSEYLLKPLIENDVIRMLKQNFNIIVSQKYLIEDQVRIAEQNKSLQLERALKDIFMFDVFENYYDVSVVRGEEFYCLAVIQCYNTKRDIIGTAKRYDSDNMFFYRSCFRKNEIIAISYGSNEIDVCKNLVAAIEEIDDICANLSIKTATGISRAEKDIYKLNSVYGYCLDALIGRFSKTNSSIYRCRYMYQVADISADYKNQLDEAQRIFENVKMANKLESYQDGVELLIKLCETSFSEKNGYLQLCSVLSQVFSIILLMSPANDGKVHDTYSLTEYLSGEIINTMSSCEDIEVCIRGLTSEINQLDAVPSDGQSTVYKAKQMVDLHYNEELSLETFSEMFYIEIKYLSKLFKRCLGINFTDYLASVRMKKAKELLLSTSFSVVKIASLVGYKDHQYFHRVFKHREGKTPNEYRLSAKALGA